MTSTPPGDNHTNNYLCAVTQPPYHSEGSAGPQTPPTRQLSQAHTAALDRKHTCTGSATHPQTTSHYSGLHSGRCSSTAEAGSQTHVRSALQARNRAPSALQTQHTVRDQGCSCSRAPPRAARSCTQGLKASKGSPCCRRHVLQAVNC
jgi:hypothetical protein